MAMRTGQRALDALMSLGDPIRRRLYDAVVAAERPVSRNELAAGTGVARALVAYHLHRLEKDGLLSTHSERQTGRTGPGAGRPAKLYQRAKTPVRVTLPFRDNDLAARLLLDAVAAGDSSQAGQTLEASARRAGADIATGQRDPVHAGEPDLIARLLEDQGYEPKTDSSGTTWLKNCVFDDLASRQRQLICGMNLALVTGMLDAVPGSGLEARLEPGEGRCCVVIGPAEHAEAAST